jgi:hypothetical protein
MEKKTKPLSAKERAANNEEMRQHKIRSDEARWLKAGNSSTQQCILDAARKTEPKKTKK